MFFYPFSFFLINLLGSSCISFIIHHDILFLRVNKEALINILVFLKKHSWCQFKQLSDITVIDYYSCSSRFVVVYQLVSIRFNFRIALVVINKEVIKLQKKTRRVFLPSVCSIFPVANWYEREAFDMFGIFFKNHPNLRRILTDYGFDGFPLRKDFPLHGYNELRFDSEKERVVCEPLVFSQEFRSFKFNVNNPLSSHKSIQI